MANYFCQFSTLLDVQTNANALKAIGIFENEGPNDDSFDYFYDGFALELAEPGSSVLWIHDGSGSGDPELVVAFVARIAEALSLKGLWALEWADTCSKSRLNAFGGSAYVLNLETGRTVAHIHTGTWISSIMETGPDLFVIAGTDEAAGLYWSNTLGWVSLSEADQFTEYETHTLDLPIGGFWLKQQKPAAARDAAAHS